MEQFHQTTLLEHARTLGEHESKLDLILSEMQAVRADLTTVKNALAEVRGGSKVVWVVFTAFGALGSWLFNEFFRRTNA
jgi:hypothetical protein